MKAIPSFIILLLFYGQAVGQDVEQAKIDRLVAKIETLDASELVQKAKRSNRDFCALEVTFGYPTDDPPSKEVMMLRLGDLDENEIDIEYDPELSEWDLSVYCVEFDQRVLVTSDDTDNYYESILMVSDKDKEVLEELKEILISAILVCKGE